MHREKQNITPLHRLALILLAITAGWNLLSVVTEPAPHWSSREHLGLVIFVSCLWSLFIWKVWTRPRSWGKGVGIVMVCVVLLHGWMWYRGVQNFKRMGQELEFVPGLVKFLPYEVLFLTTGIVCLVLAKQLAVGEKEKCGAE
ncbi:hypothetical protein [Roseimicrobium sp. ORNL1]|uniref:hypothetical protein n=1 Tax=Roseimicrobium sp. ORNL1 TaxID=2711231 RepID=UPI0013E20337|nr:hypothetical protein [Roseimicrobium sp. ORNL1]QIF00937.1 hypothetical protein G5S37_05195 [Roseimicrobium sp. ORNL1]